MSLLFPIVVCVSYLLLSRRLTAIKLILCNLSIPLSVCHYCLLISDNLSIPLSVCHYCLLISDNLSIPLSVCHYCLFPMCV